MASFKDVTEYLEARGITTELRKKYKLELLGGTEAALRLGFRQLPDTTVGCWFPGEGKYGHCVLIAGGGGFSAALSRKRYCPNGMHDAVLLPGHDWSIAPERVVFTESYIKGIIAAEQLGLPTIALNGVAGYNDRNHSSRIVRTLRNLPWKGRGVRATIIYDSLSTTSEESASNVRRSREHLAAMLRIRYGSDTDCVEIPAPSGGGQQGLDDFCQAGGRLTELPTEPLEVDEIGAAVINFNERFSVVKDLSRIVELTPPFRRMGQGDFRLNYGNEKYTDAEGNRHNICEVWLNASSRTTLDKVRFLPGSPTIVDNQLNMWAGLSCTPDYTGVPEAKEAWVGLIHEAIPDGASWLLDAWAALLQFPERRCGFYIYLYGDYGTGKGYTLSPIKAILGGDAAHAPTIRTMDYCGRFNAPKAVARVIIVDEVQEDMDSESKARMEAELKLDSDPGQGTRPLEYKGRDIIQVDRNALVTILSNLYTPPWPIDTGDRRAAMFEYSRHMAIYDEENRPWGTKNFAWWRERHDWMTKEGGQRKVLAYLLERDVSKFDVEAPPMVTRYKRDVTVSKMGAEGFIQQLRLDPKASLNYAGVDLSMHRYWTSELLLHLYHQGEEGYQPDVRAKEAFGKKMRSAGFSGLRTKCRWYKSPDVVLWLLWGPDGERSAEFKALVTEMNPHIATSGRGKY